MNLRHQGPWELLQGLITSRFIVSTVNGMMVINILYDSSFSNFQKKFIKFLEISLSFSKSMLAYWPTKPFKPWRWVTWQNFRDKNSFTFCCELVNFAFFNLFDLFTSKAKKLEVAESNPIMENIPLSFSLSPRVSFLFLVRVLCLSLSLSLCLCRASAALMWRNMIIFDSH